ncbi:TIGR01620 family protein [Candidatus Halobeggiatoa sp. HSG11]|nr:TIGR01620 family protein [Candidatus Halobeggiatoa sp. HSG11]
MTSWTKPIFFELDKIETIAEEEAAITLDYAPSIILPEDSKLEIDNTLPVHESEIQQNNHEIQALTNSPWLWLLGALSSLLLLMLLDNTYQFIAQQYENSYILGNLFLSLVMIITGATLTLSWRSYQKIHRLQTVAKLQQEGEQLMTNDGYGNAMRYVNKITQFYNYRPEIKTRLEHFYLTISDSHHDREVCDLFSDFVLKDIDQQAYKIVTKRSQETALWVMISQIVLLDTVLTLWRNARMIRDVAELYGAKPGFLGSFKLVGTVMQSLIYAGVSEMAADNVAEIVGGSVLSIMSAQVAQGLGSGLLTARVGMYAMQACRPLPFVDENKPKIKDIRREIVASLKGAVEKP